METSDRSQLPKPISHYLQIQDGNPRINPHFTQRRGMGHLNRPLRCIPTYSHPPSIKKILQVPSQWRSVQQPTLGVGHSPSGIHLSCKGGKTSSLKTQYSSAPIPNQSPISARITKTHNQAPLSGSKPGLYCEAAEIRTHSPADVQLHRLPFFAGPGSCQTLRRQMGQNPECIFQHIQEVCHQCKDSYISTIGLLASTEKTVKLGRIHMRPFQWHLKTRWKFPMPLNSPIPWTWTMEQHREWWLNPENILSGEFLHPRDHDVLIFTDASNAGWGAHLNHDSTGLWSQVEKQLHINVLELKVVILALQHFSKHCLKKQVLVASDNTTVVAHINKQGGTHSTELCALMWRLLTWCNKHQITLRARHVPGSLNVIADGLSRRNQIQHIEWSLSPQIFKQITLLWERPQIDLFATNLNTKLPTYVSPIPDPQAWVVDALNISWKNIIGYTFPPTALLPRVVQKLLSQECRLILIAPGWPTKPWFWDLMELSLDHPRQLPPIRSLLKQPLNNQFHTHPESLNLHAWYLGVQPSRAKVSLQKWQIELLHLRDTLLGPSMPQNGPSFNVGASNNR